MTELEIFLQTEPVRTKVNEKKFCTFIISDDVTIHAQMNHYVYFTKEGYFLCTASFEFETSGSCYQVIQKCQLEKIA